MMKCIVLCADDYGQAPAISEGILELAELRRITSVSCLVTSQYWQHDAKFLVDYYGSIDIGLHFNLTEGKAISSDFVNVYGAEFFTLKHLMLHSILHRLNPEGIQAECKAQLDRFVDCMGFLPDFIDGHQHVHQFPIIRDAVIKTYEAYLDKNKTYIRLARERISFQDISSNFKKIVISQFGNSLKILLDQHQIAYNPTFSGIYTFSKANAYSTFFSQFLAKLGQKGLLMCHPGVTQDQDDDAIKYARYEEYRFFTSDIFLEICEQHGVKLSRFYDT